MVIFQGEDGKRRRHVLDLPVLGVAVATRLGIVMPFVLTVALQGCVPVRFSGYQPSGPGTVEGRSCVASIKDVHRDQTDTGVQILTRAGQNTLDNTIQLHIELIVPEGVTVQLLSLEFVAISPEWAGPQILRAREIGSYVATEELQIHGARGDLGNFSLRFVPRRPAQTPLPKVDTFTLQFPPLRINDHVYRPESVNFHAYKEWSIYTCI